MRSSSRSQRLAIAAMVTVLALLSGFTSLLTTSAQSETPPDKPSGLSTEAGDTQVRLSWEDPTDSTIDKYQLWQIAERATLTAAYTDLDDQFGDSVAVAGDAAVVGMPGDDDTQNNSGAVLVFTRDSNGDWSQAAKLKAGDAGADDNFGTSVALDGNTMVVAAFWDDDNGSQSGSVYVFTEPTGGWGGWDSLNALAKAALTAKIVPAGVAAGDEFGRSVAVDDSTRTIVAGAWHDDSNEGSAYVFTEPTGGWGGWNSLTGLAKANLTATLTASNAAVNDYFGHSVAVDGDTVLIGASGRDSGKGAVYAFTKPETDGGWTGNLEIDTVDETKLTAGDGADNDFLGAYVAIDDGTAVIGAIGDGANEDDGDNTNDLTNAGSAYVFIEGPNGWSQAAKLTASDREVDARDDSQFGISVAVSGGIVVVGADGVDQSATETNFGAAYIFTKPTTGWADNTETAKLTASDGNTNHDFGSSVAIDGDTVVVGAEGKDSGEGAAYAFDIVDWNDIAGSNAATTSHIVTGLTNDIDHTFRVRALDSTEASDPSDSVSETPTAAAYPPARPRNFSATQTGIGEVELTWDAHRYPLTVTGYEYNQDDGGGPSLWTDIDGSDSSTVSHTVTSLTAVPTYTFAVRAVNSAGSTEADSRSLKLSEAPAAPDSFSAVAGDEQVWLGWRSPADFTISGYEYQQKEGTDAFGDWQAIPGSRSGATFHIVTGLTNGTSYTFQVRAVNAAGESGSSGEQSATPATASSAPVKPEGFSARQTGVGHVELTWVASSNPLDVTGYEFRQDNGSWTTISGSDSRTVSHSVTGLTQGVTYTFRVRAKNSAGNGVSSGTESVIVVAEPAAPTDLAAEAGDTQVGLTWKDPGNASITKYQVLQFPESIKLISSDHAKLDELGWSVAVDGDTLVIGALGDDPDNTGAAYVFTRGARGWSQVGKLTAAVRRNDAGFGYGVAVHGDTIVVGAYEDDIEGDDAGAAYVFTRPANGWADMTQTARLTAGSDAADGDEFGKSVAVHGDTIVVGAPEQGADAEGAAYIFTKPANGWADGTETAKLSGDGNGDRFGRSVAVHGDTIVVGSNDGDDAKGEAYVFTKSAVTGVWDDWDDKSASNATARLTASARANNDYFGRSVAVEGETIVVGAPYDDNKGSAHVFSKPDGGWTSTSTAAKLTASVGTANDQFGFSVALDGNTVVVGADQDDSSRGSVYVFTKPQDGWTDTEGKDPLTAYDRSQNDRFGNFVAVDGDTVLVGAVGDDSDKGSAYVFGTGEWADIPGSGAGTDSHIARGLRNNVKHTFRVRAANAAGEGGASEVAATPVAATSAPAAPANFDAEQTGVGQVELTWDTAGARLTVTGYQYTADGGSNWSDISGSDSGTVSHIVSGLMVDTMYTFAVRAVNSGMLSGFSSSFRDVTIIDVPNMPTGLGTTSGDTQATFHWNVTVETTDRPIDKHQLVHLPQSKLTADDGADDDEFGYSVATDGNTAVVGAPGSNSNAGAAYVFVFTEADDDGVWSQAAKLTAPVPVTGDKFGVSVAIDGDTIVVGAHQPSYQDENDVTVEVGPGAAYVFIKPESGGWATATETAKLTASDGSRNDSFGHSVAVVGDTVVVGAYGDDGNRGAAYVFTKTGGAWTSTTTAAKLTASDGEANDEFGVSVAVDEDTVAVGAHLHDLDVDGASMLDAGAVYVFTKPAAGWTSSTESAKLTATDGAAGDEFGISVAINVDAVVVGAHLHDVGANANAGAAYVFTRDSNSGKWGQPLKLTASNGHADDGFGNSVAVDGNTAVVGAYLDDRDNAAPDTGSTYVFARKLGVWSQTLNLAGPGPDRKDGLGYSVALDDGTLLAGAPQDDDSRGFAYAMDISNAEWVDFVSTELTEDDGYYVYRVLDLTNDQEYAFRVRSVNAAAKRPSAETAGATPMSAKPGRTEGLSAQPGDSQVTLSWRDPRDSSLTGYQVLQPTGQTKLTAGSDREANEEFGESVAVDDGTAVVGAPEHDINGNANAGAAYVFTRDPLTGVWSDQIELTAGSGGVANDWFGYSVAVDGDTIVVGAYQHDLTDDENNILADAGAAYVFTWAPGSGEWSEPAKLTASDGAANDRFGYSVAVDGDTIVVGAYQHDLTDDENKILANAGAAYVFTWDSDAGVWGDDPDSGETHREETVKLTASGGAGFDYFGHSVAVDRDTIVVGARGYSGSPGAAYIFTKVGGVWGRQKAKLTASNADDHDQFGQSVAVDGNTVVVGAQRDDGAKGSAYVFTKPTGDNWADNTETARLAASDRGASDSLGASVAIRGSTIVVGAYAADIDPEDDGDRSGAAYVFTKPAGEVWANDPNEDHRTESGKLTLPTEEGAVEKSDEFGNSVALDGQSIVVGAPRGNDDFGSVYVSDIPQWGFLAWGAETTCATVGGLTNGVEYAFQVRAIDSYGEGLPSNIARATPKPAPAAPNGAPYFIIDSDSVTFTVDENTPLGSPVGDAVTAEDPDRDVLTYSLSGIDASSFVLDGSTGQITVGSGTLLDYESGSTRYTVVVSVHDGRGAYGDDDSTIDDLIEVSIDVSNVDEAGTVSVSLEQPEVGTAVAASLSDPDGLVSNISWQWARSSDGSDWSDISGANSDSYTPVADDVGIYLQATASYTDGHGPGKSEHAVMEQSGPGTPRTGGDTDDHGDGHGPGQTAQPAPAAPNRAPYFIIGSDSVTFTVDENTPPGSLVGDAVTAKDPDGDVLTYSLSGIDASSFVLDGSTGQITVGSGTLLDYESGSTRYTVVVSVHDGRGAYGDDDSTIDDLIEVSIDVSNVDEAGTVSVSLEQPEVGTAVAASLSDPDGLVSDISWQWARSSDGSDWSDISGANSDSYTPVADDVGIYLQATASYTDGHGPGKSAHAVMERQTAQRGPSFEGDVTFTVDENTPPGSLVGDAVTAKDPDGDVLTYSLSGIDASSFVLDGSTGQITVGSGTLLDYESGSTRYTVVVSVHVGRGAYGDDDSTIDDLIEVSIDVSNVDEAGTVSVSLEQPEVGTAVAASLSDPDGLVSNISWQWARSSDPTDWQDMAGASSFTYTPVDLDADKYLRVTASYADGEGSGKQAQAVLNNPVQGLPEPVATPTTTATDTPAPEPTPTPTLTAPTPTAEPAPSEADGGDEGFPWWVIVAVVIGVVAGVVLIIVVLRSRR